MVPHALLLACLLLQSVSDPVARAGEMSWGRDEYSRWLFERHGVPLVYEFVREKVVLAEAARRGMTPSEAEVETALQQEIEHILETAYGNDKAKWQRDIEMQGYSVETWLAIRKAAVRQEVALATMIRADRDLSEERIVERFQAQYGEHGERIALETLFFNAYHGVVPGGRVDLAALKSAARKRAEQARAEWVAGKTVGELFAESDDPGREFILEGVLADYRPKLLGKEIDAAVSSLDRPGDVSPPIDTFDGVWLVRLTTRVPIQLDDLRDALRQELLDLPIDTGEVTVLQNALMKKYEAELLLR